MTSPTDPAGRPRDGRPRPVLSDIHIGVLIAEIDPDIDETTMRVFRSIASWPAYDLDGCIRAGDMSLNRLCGRLPRIPRPLVFYAVALLEDHHYLPKGGIR